MQDLQLQRRHLLVVAAPLIGVSLLLSACTGGSTSASGGKSSSAVTSGTASSSSVASPAASGVGAASGAAASAIASSAPPAAGGIDSLTGAPAQSAAAATRPALGVKIDNVEGAWPQAGLNQADIVFDIPVEGGLTRLLAIFHSQDVPLFGPIRSARPVDADILHLLGHAYFAFSGGTSSDLGPINDHSNATPMWWDVTPSLFIIRTDHEIPHQVFGSTQMLYAGGEARSPSTTPPPAMFSYSATAPAGATPATNVVAQFPSATGAWSWNGSVYLRNQSGHPDLLIGGAQVSSNNVVVMSVGVDSTAARDSHGTVVPLPVVIGSGPVWVFRNGVMVQGTWSRPTENSAMTLRTPAGQVIALTPGRTWVELLPNSSQPQIS